MRVQLDGFELGYQLEGPNDGPVLALGHCFASNRQLWALQVPALLEAGYRVLRYDARGHGESGAPADPFSLSDMADDVVALLDALDIERVHYCGISMSGMVGQFLGLNHGGRLRSLVLANTCSAYSVEQRAAWTARFEQIAREGPAALIEDVMKRWFAPESLAREAHGVAIMRSGFVRMRDDVRLNIMTNLRDIDLTRRLHEISVPTLVIASDRDLATPLDRAEAIHAEIPDSELVVIPDAGHLPPGENPEAFNEALLGFLGRQLDG